MYLTSWKGALTRFQTGLHRPLGCHHKPFLYSFGICTYMCSHEFWHMCMKMHIHVLMLIEDRGCCQTFPLVSIHIIYHGRDFYRTQSWWLSYPACPRDPTSLLFKSWNSREAISWPGPYVDARVQTQDLTCIQQTVLSTEPSLQPYFSFLI